MTRTGTGSRALRAAVAIVAAAALAPVPARAGLTALEARNRSFELLNEGVRLYKEGNHREAIVRLREASGISLNSFMAHFYLGLTYNALRRYGEAIAPLQLSLDLQPDHIQAHIALGNAFLKQGDIPEARAEFLRALNLQQDYAPALEGLGRLHESTGEDAVAIDYYERAVRINAAFPDSYTSLGDLYLRLGRTEEGIRLFLEAIRLRPDFAPAYHRLAETYFRQKRYQLAIAATRKAEALEPNDALYPTLLGRIYLDLDLPTRGLEKLHRAMELDPDYPEPFRILAAWHRRNLDLERAIEVLERALAGEIRDPESERETRVEKRQYEADLAEHRSLESALAADPGEPAHSLALARFAATAGAFPQAVAHQRRAMELMDDPAPLRADLGYFLARAGRYEDSAAMFETLAAEAPGNPLHHLNLAVTRAGTGDHRGADAALAAALALRPDLPAAHLFRGNARFRLGDREAAAASYREYLRLEPEGDEALRVREILRLLGPDRRAAETRVPPGGSP
ncbi:MAG: tetratricopeptide repeat protein [Acidobacteria bacterium]|nr:tetratricopeptide repeat protein [Acidobacteriota bacterium]